MFIGEYRAIHRTTALNCFRNQGPLVHPLQELLVLHLVHLDYILHTLSICLSLLWRHIATSQQGNKNY